MNEPLAIVGMACRLPGADGLDAFWSLVSEGRTAWGKLPESRLSRELYFHPEKSRVGKSYSEMGAVVSDRPVDPAVCPITAEMMERFDVAHHIFLEVASLACRDAGLDPFAMPADRRTGVYVGHTGGSTRIGDIVYGTGIDEAASLLAEVDVARDLLGPAAAEVAAEVTDEVRRRYPGRRPGQTLDLGAIGAAKIVQEALKLDGPYLVVDAACASSLQAMAIGARSLLEGGIDQAIVGGASYCKSDSLVLFSAAQSVSNAGSCPFGAQADGLITAEGYVALVIKKLSRAIADGDRIRAVIRGLGVASDGKGKSLWAPRQEGQVLAVERAYPDTSDIARIEYIEAHATSTQVGDATELAALSRLMARHLPPGRQIPIGSVKANIGHTLETAGIASLVKVVLAMEHGLIPPGSTCTEFNTEFDWQGGPFRVPLQPVAWPAHGDGSPRCAAVNAFGIGGLNVHVALAEHVPARQAEPPARGDEAQAEAIAIVGAGCVLPGGLTLDAFFERLDRGETAIGPVPPERWLAARALDRSGPRTWHTTADQGGFVRGFAYDWRRHKVPPKQIAAANPLQFMLLEAADAAIADAGGPQAGLDRTRTGVVVGTLFGGEFANQLQIGLRLPETGRILRAALGRRGLAAADIDRVVESYEKKVLEKMPALIDETGSFTSSTLASRLTKTFDLMGGALALDAGDCSSVSALSAAVDMLRQRSCDAVICAAGDRSMDLMAYEIRSLAGTLAGEPTSVLDRRAAAADVPGEGAVVFVLKRLADARAAGDRIRGVIRGVSVGSGRSIAAAARRVIREACEQAAVAPAAVCAVELATGVGVTVAGGGLAALRSHYASGRSPVAGSLDGLIGHTGAASGAAAVLKLSRALASGSLPGSAAVRETGAEGFLAAGKAIPLPVQDQAGYRAGCVTAADGSLLGHVVIDNGLPVPDAVRPRAATRTPVPAAAAEPAAAATGRPLVAALFPGQGSQYTDMFRGLVEDCPEARAVLGRLDGLARSCGHDSLSALAWRPDNGLGTQIWDTQWGMYLGDLLAWGVLQDMGFAPDFVASHSFGEFPSLTAVGAWSAEDGARATQARAAAVERHGPRNGAMLSVIADRATVRKAIEPFAGQVWVCAENAPEQSVIGGTARVVDAVEVMLEATRVKSKRLAVPSPFHTPLLAGAAEELATTIRAIDIAPPRVPTFSSTTAAALTSAGDIRESLIRQMTETVRWVDVVERLYASGVRIFVEVGPSGVLTGLTRRILEGRAGTTFIQFDQRGRAPREHLDRLRDQLAAAGALGGTAASAPTQAKPVARGRIVAFDATARRRERNRSGGGGTRPLSQPSAPVVAPASETVPPTRATGGDAPGRRSAVSVPAPRPGGGSAPALEPVALATATVSQPVAAEPQFLEDFVSALLDEAGLELPLAALGAADDGVCGFLESAGHLFAITAADHGSVLAAASLDDLCDVLARSGGKARWLARRSPSQSAAARVTAAAVSAGPDAAEIEAFLIDFVVEQTGYPREIVELGADLEADLGIDSIRKAQLFGEIGQKYGLTADDSVSLDEFPTLRHLLDYMLPRVGAKRGGAPVAAAPSRPVAQPRPASSAAFERGLAAGREHAVAITAWARQMAAVGSTAAGRSAGPDVDDALAGVAAAAGLEPSVVRAAFAEPARALGGCDFSIVAPADSAAARAVVVCLGRHADPLVRTFDAAGLRGGLVGVKGLPGAVCGWNDAGLVAVAGRGCDGATTLACERILTTCRSRAEAEQASAACAAVPHGLVVASMTGGGFAVAAAGGVEPFATSIVRAEPQSPLARVLLADGARPIETAAAAVLENLPGVGDALSATCVWLALGAAKGRLVGRAGGPAATSWAPAVADLGVAWQAVAAAQAVASPRAAAAPSADVTRRYGLDLRVAAPLQSGRRLAGERVLIVNAAAATESFIAAVRAAGGAPIAVECGSAEEAIAAVERAEESGAVRHLVVVAPRAAAGGWLAGRAAAVIAPFFACQRWLMLRAKAGDVARSTLTGVTALGGGFGIGTPIAAPEGGAICGLFKGLAREVPGLHVRVLDAAAAMPADEMAKAALAELQDGAGPVEVAVVNGRRMHVVPVEGRPQAAAPLAALAAGSVWIVTGGARGVTAECCRELGRRHGLVLALVGSTTPVPVEPRWLTFDEAGLRDLKGRTMLEAKARGEDPRATWRRVEKSIEVEKSLAKFRAAGVAVRYYACNLADAASVRATVKRITTDLGPIRGIVHGAGFEAACRFEKKTLEGLEATLGPKCAGLEHLLAAVDPATLEAVIGFGSTSGRLGGHGQADYSLANDMLAKLVGSLRQRRAGLRGTVFHWHAWDEVGMASRPESRFVLEQFGLKFMPLAEGVRRFMDEVEAGLPDAEVLVTEPAMCPDAVVVPGGDLPPAGGTAVGSLVEGVAREGATLAATFRLNPCSDRFLLDHKQYGRPLLPAVMGMELLAQAAVATGECGSVAEIRDFVVERPIAFPVDQPRVVRVEVAPGTGGLQTRAFGAVLNAEGRAAGEERLHLRGLVMSGAEPIVAVAEPAPLPFYPTTYREDSPLWHGASMRTLNGLFLDRSGGWARLTALPQDDAAAPRGARGWTVPIALVDGCIMACGIYSYVMCGQRVEVPVRIDRFRIVARPQPGEKCDARLRFRGQDARETAYDFVLFGADGRPLLAIDGLHLAVMAPERSRPA